MSNNVCQPVTEYGSTVLVPVLVPVYSYSTVLVPV